LVGPALLMSPEMTDRATTHRYGKRVVGIWKTRNHCRTVLRRFLQLLTNFAFLWRRLSWWPLNAMKSITWA